MKKIIVYGSEYGYTKRYALGLSRQTAIPAIGYQSVHELNSYDVIVYLGGLYAGGMLGLAKTVKALNGERKQTLLIVSVGLADTKEASNLTSIKASIKKQVPEGMYRAENIFHLRGGIDYKKLSFKHRSMMTLLVQSVKRKPIEKQTSEMKELIATYNQTVDFVDYECLNQVVEALRQF